jgi:ATP-dependent DNA helicase DinG
MDLEGYFKEFQEAFMPKDFVWRKGQKEAIEQIILAYFDKQYDTVILDAPVGSGKSLIAMCTSWILNQEGKKGYILSSDISLQDQYELDLSNFNFSWGSIKGLDNYECIDNLERVSMGTCKIQRKEARKMPCYDECPYYSARSKASRSPTSMMNYAYWLTMMNDVNPKMDEEKQIFPMRNFTFCDEGHKILDIIQGTYSPRFSDKTLEKIEKLTDFFTAHHVADLNSELGSIRRHINLLKEEENQDKLHGYLARIVLDLMYYNDPIDILKNRVAKEYDKKPPKEWRQALWLSDWAVDFRGKLEDYVQIISETSTRNIIKNPNLDEIVFNCLEEKYLMHKYFHAHTGFAVFMSATFSDPSEYLKGIALKSAKYIKLQSQFNFEKSPIYYYNARRMSYKQIESNLPWLINKVNTIIANHKDESGLIHSASYKLSMDIFNGLTPENRRRVLIYNGTEEKRTFLEDLKNSKDKVLIGPSLLEGLDMKDDFGRFQIFAKVPYLSLGDRFVKTKMEINPGWYRWKAIINILQGTGRIVRNENDWGITYILDGSLSDLIHNNRKSFPIEFMKRIQVISD